MVKEDGKKIIDSTVVEKTTEKNQAKGDAEDENESDDISEPKKTGRPKRVEKEGRESTDALEEDSTVSKTNGFIPLYRIRLCITNFYYVFRRKNVLPEEQLKNLREKVLQLLLAVQMKRVQVSLLGNEIVCLLVKMRNLVNKEKLLWYAKTIQQNTNFVDFFNSMTKWLTKIWICRLHELKILQRRLIICWEMWIHLMLKKRRNASRGI